MKRFAGLLVLTAALFGQDPPPGSKTPVLNSAVSGIVRDKGTGQPLAGYTVSTYVGAAWVANSIQMRPGTKTVKATTDESGRYRLADLPAAPYRVTARSAKGGFGSDVTRYISLSGHDVDDVNFDVVVAGVVKGTIMDENKDPVPGITVVLVSREYYLGSSGYFFRSASAPSNDRGEYTIQGVPAGESFYLMAELRRQQLPAHSDSPLNPKLRRRVPMRTWYPNSPAKEGTAPVMLRPAEIREHVDIEVKKSPAFCAEGTLLTAAGGPGVLGFRIEGQQPSSGTHEGGGMYLITGFGRTGSDGAFRICDLSPGSYRIEASEDKGDPLFGVSLVNIKDEDVKGLKVAALAPQPVEGEVVLEGPIPATPLAVKVSVDLLATSRSFHQGERASAKADIPGNFTLPAVIADDYQVRTVLNAPGLYIKDVQWGGISIQYAPLRLGSSAGSGLRVVMGQDGGSIATAVATKDGLAAQDMHTVAFPADITSEGMLAAAMVYGQTDQTGAWSSQTLAPGRYYVGGVDVSVGHSMEFIARLWRSRSRFTQVELAAKGKAQVALQPILLAP